MATRNALLIVALVLTGGCSTTWYERLPREADLPVQCELAQKAADLPNHRGYVTVGEVHGEPVRVAYRHTRAGRSGWLVVMLSGVLADSTALRQGGHDPRWEEGIHGAGRGPGSTDCGSDAHELRIRAGGENG